MSAKSQLEKEIREAYIFLREKNQTIPSDTLQFMLDASLEHLKTLKDVSKPETGEIFTDEFLKEIGFKLVKREHSKFSPYQEYGEAKDRTGMTVLNWNVEGASCTYFGEKLEKNIYLGIGKDGGTRHAFNGYVYTQDDVRKILSLTW